MYSSESLEQGFSLQCKRNSMDVPGCKKAPYRLYAITRCNHTDIRAKIEFFNESI